MGRWDVLNEFKDYPNMLTPLNVVAGGANTNLIYFSLQSTGLAQVLFFPPWTMPWALHKFSLFHHR